MQEEIAIRFYQIIRDSGMTQSHIAKKLGINRNYLNLKLHAKHPFTIPEFLGLCRMFNVRPESFLES